MLEMLYRHIETPEYQCRFRWQPRSIAFWDNRGVQHHAMWDYFPQRRHGHRVTVSGDKPFYRPCPAGSGVRRVRFVVGAHRSRLNVQKVRLAGCLRAPPRQLDPSPRSSRCLPDRLF